MEAAAGGRGPPALSRRERQQRRAKSPSNGNVSSSPTRNPRQRSRQTQQQNSPPQPAERRRSAKKLIFSDESTAPGEDLDEEEEETDDDDDGGDGESQSQVDRRGTRAPAPPIPRQRQRQRSGGSSTGTAIADAENNNEAEFAFSKPPMTRSMSRSGPGGGGRPSSSDTIDLPRQIDRLQRDLTRREQELGEERTENERAITRIRKLERDKSELEQELEEVRDELNEYVIKYDELRTTTGSPSSSGKKRLQFQDQSSEEQANVLELNEIVEAKNREIATLLEDVEKLEDEKLTLHQTLADLRDSLQEATTQIEGMTQESADLKSMLEKMDVKIQKLEEEKTILEIKERDLLTFKERHEKYLENLCSAVDVRVDVWKRMMIEKDEEIDRLNVKIGALLAQIPNTQIDNDKSAIRQLKKRILDREEQINLLNQQLHQATVDIETHTKTILELQSKLNYSQNNDQTQKFVHSLEAKLKKYSAALQQKSQAVHTYEKEIEERSREVTQLMSRLHEYETGQYGLVDAISEIKGLKGQQRVRDKQIEELTQDVNQLQLARQDVLDENDLLRSKLGLTDENSLRQETAEFVRSRVAEIERAKNKIRVLENEVVELKSKNYGLRKEVAAMATQSREAHEQHERASSLSPSSSLPSTKGRRKSKTKESPRPRSGDDRLTGRQSAHTMTTPTIMDQIHVGQDYEPGQLQTLSASPDPEWKEKYEIILDENTELRKGLVEILESIRRLSDENTSNVLIESPILENLLREMSARGLINYPYSVSGFHLKVCNLEGKNSELREEVHRLRSEEKQLRTELVETKVQLQNSQQQLTELDRLNQNVISPAAGGVLAIAPGPRQSASQLVQTEESLSDVYESHVQINQLKTQVGQLETLLNAKDQVLNEFKMLHIETYKQSQATSTMGISGRSNAELEDALQVARDSITNLQERLKVKEDNITSYRKLLAEVRSELTASAERHVQEMRALQDTIYQQQQAYSRMKSTLSQPVRDNLNIEGALRDQLMRINELEDEVSELQHTLGNVASQLTSARSEANKWKALADAKIKELDAAKEQLSEDTLEELKLLREKLRTQEELIREFRIGGRSRSPEGSPGTGGKSVRFSIDEIRNESEIVMMLRAELADKERRLNTYTNAIQGFKRGGRPKSGDKQSSDGSREKEIQELKEKNCQLQQKITSLTLKISRINAVNQHSGVSAELEDLRSRMKTIQEEKSSLQRRFDELQMKGHDDEEKRRKQIDSLARWDESKKWKKIVEKFESRIQELETENEKLLKTNQTLRLIVTRLEKEKHLVDSKLLHHTRSVSKLSKSRDSLMGGEETGTTTTGVTDSEQAHALQVQSTEATIDKLRLEAHDLKETLQKTELESRQTEERLRMEIRVLKERITSQERQITAYQVASKGDPKIIAEIEKMVHNEESLQKQLLKLEEENLHLNLQMEQLKMDTPRLRDRVQHLQKLVEVLKVEKPSGRTIVTTTSPFKVSTNQKSLSELERTISALKNVIDKLQSENKKLKRPATLSVRKSAGLGGSGSTEKLKASITNLLDEKQLLLDQLHELEHEKQKYHQMYLDSVSTIDHLQINLMDTDKKAKSAEMKLKSFLNQKAEEGPEGLATATGPSGNEKMFQYMRDLQEKLDRKEKLLAEAKEALKEAAASSAKAASAHAYQS